MHTLWKLRQGFLKEVVENSPDPEPHSNTIATLLKILVDKGFVRYIIEGSLTPLRRQGGCLFGLVVWLLLFLFTEQTISSLRS